MTEMSENGRLERMRRANDAELVRRNLAADQQDLAPGLQWPAPYQQAMRNSQRGNSVPCECEQCDCINYRRNGDVITGENRCRCTHLAMRHIFREEGPPS